jgi:hypothetical protein
MMPARAMERGSSSITIDESSASDTPLPDRMEDGLRKFHSRVLFILSGNNLTAQEFKNVVAGSSRWRRLLEDSPITRRDLPEANHAFARRTWRDQVARWTEAWIRNL